MRSAQRVVDRNLRADRRVRSRGGGQVGGQVDLGGGDRIVDALGYLDRLQLGAVDSAGGLVDRPAVQVATVAVHQIAVAVHGEIAGAGVVLLRREIGGANLPVGHLADREKPLAGNRHGQRVAALGNRTLHIVLVIRRGAHRAGLVVGGRAAGQQILEAGAGALEADGLAVGDVVADITKGVGLRGQPADRRTHRAEQRHDRTPGLEETGTFRSGGKTVALPEVAEPADEQAVPLVVLALQDACQGNSS